MTQAIYYSRRTQRMSRVRARLSPVEIDEIPPLAVFRFNCLDDKFLENKIVMERDAHIYSNK